MPNLTLTSVQKIIRKTPKVVLFVTGGILVILLLFPLIKKTLLNMAYAWEARKPVQVAYPNLFAGNPDFQSLSLNPNQWKFDSRIHFSVQPDFVYQAVPDLSFSLAEDKQKELRRALGFSDAEQSIQQEASLVWYENNLYFAADLEKHSLSFSTSFAGKSTLLEKGAAPGEEEALAVARDFFTKTLGYSNILTNTATKTYYLAFDPLVGYRLTQDLSEASVTLVSFYPVLDGKKVYGIDGFAQIGLAQKNKIIFFDLNPLSFSVNAGGVFLKSGVEVKKEIQANQGFLDMACANLTDLAYIRLKKPAESLLYDKNQGYILPVYVFTAIVKNNNQQECSGSLFVPALQDHYYQ